MHSYGFKSLRYIEHAQKLIIPLSVRTGNKTTDFEGFGVYDIGQDHITCSYYIRHMALWELEARGCAILPTRSFVFNSTLITILSDSLKSTDLETGKNVWTLSLQNALNMSSMSTLCLPVWE